MNLSENFREKTKASIETYVSSHTFDNNFVLADEYYKWYEETLNSDTPWTSYTNTDITIENVNHMIEICYIYSYDSGIEMPYDISGFLWMYGLAMEQDMRETLCEQFDDLMIQKQNNL